MRKGIIFLKRINGQEVDRTTILYYLLKMENLKAKGEWDNVFIISNKKNKKILDNKN